MPKGKQNVIIYLLLENGFKPMQIIKMGYSQGTVYAYKRRWEQAKKEYEKLINLKMSEVSGK